MSRQPFPLFIFVFLFFSFTFSSSFSQSVRKQSLIAAEYRKNSRIGDYTYLVAYHFSDGVFVSKDTILKTPTSKGKYSGSYVRYDLGKNFIYKNRYVISGIGNVIDLKTKSMVIQESDDFVEARGDTLLFHRNNIISGTGFLQLDLKTGSYHFIDHNEMSREQEFSPDKSKSLYVDRSKLPYKIILYELGKATILVPDAGRGPSTPKMSQLTTIETGWLDNESFLYAVYGKDHFEINKKIVVRKYMIRNHSDTIFDILDPDTEGYSNGRFFKDGIGQLIYKTSGGRLLLVDTLTGHLLPYPFFQFGYDFSEANKWSKKYGQEIRFKNSEIGKCWCSSSVVSNGVIAVEYGRNGSNLAYPKGIKIWSDQTNKWKTINIPWLSAIIGWVE